MLRLRPRSTRTDTRCPYSTPCRSEGADAARPAPGVMAASGEADHVVVAPSNPIVSIGPLLAVEGIRDALVRRRPRVVAVSPIVDGAALKGPAARMLAALGYEARVVGVARLSPDIASPLVIPAADAHLAPDVEAQGLAGGARKRGG